MKNELKRKNILTNEIFKKYIFPCLFMAASESLSIIIGSVIAGNVLGEKSLAALNLILPLSLFITAISCIIGIGTIEYINVQKGRMNTKGANKAYTLSFITWAILGTIGVLFSIFGSKLVATFLSSNADLIPEVDQYLKVYLLGSPLILGMLTFPYIISGDGFPKMGALASIISNCTNLFFAGSFMRNTGIQGGATAIIMRTFNWYNFVVSSLFQFKKTHTKILQN